jgi:signal peptidase I
MTLTLTDLFQQRPDEPAPVAPIRRQETARALLAVGALTYLTALVVLLTWSVLPALLGWSSYVVQSGSMMPAIRPGDVLVSAPVDGVRPLRHGDIAVVDDPTRPGEVLSHRVARVRDDGFVITRGDANEQADSTPVSPDAVRGQGRLLVPYVGLPQRWLVSGEHALLAGWLAVTLLALLAVATDPTRRSGPTRPRHRDRRPPYDRGDRRRGTSGARSSFALRVVGGATATGVAMTTALTAAQDDHVTNAAFHHVTANSGNAFASRPDWVAPDASAVTVYKTKGYLTGAVRPGGPYRVHANVGDTGNPPSGTASVRADMTALTSGAGTTALTSVSTSVGGLSYNYGTAPLSVGSGVTNGAKPYSLTMTDMAGYSRTRGYNVTVDGTAPTAVNVDASNTSGGTQGKPETGDTYTLTFSERIDPYSVIDGWTGAPRSVYLVIQRTPPSNTITVWPDGSGPLPLGQVVTDKDRYTDDYVYFTGSTMTQSGSTISVVLGTPSSGAVKTVTDTSPGQLTWNPSGTPYDAAGNPMSTASVTEGGQNDLDF